jgi:glutamine amidotransferase
MDRIAVIDYGMGNLHSAAKAVQKVAPHDDVVVTSDVSVIESADRIFFPGVGAIGDCMKAIREAGIDRVLADQVRQKPTFGICVGMQSLFDHSEESGGVDALGILPGQVLKFGEMHEHGKPLKVPHMGWNQVTQIEHPIWHNIRPDARFYFVHSYYVNALDRDSVFGKGHYGIEFDALVAVENLVACQFHPEKSGNDGLQLIKNFVDWNGQC